MQRRDVLRGAAYLAALAAVPPHLSAATDAGESRIIFDESLSWLTPYDAGRCVRRVREAGFNVIAPCVWHGAGATWRSPHAPRISDYPGGDPLAELCSIAAASGLEVHPWFTVALRQRDFLPQFVLPGTPAQMFEMHLPQFRDYMAELILDVVARYPVQGINLDYIRAGGISSGEFAAADYQRHSGRNLQVDRLLRTDAAAEAIARWQADAVADLVRKVASGARRTRPGLVISVCGHPGVRDVWLQGQQSDVWSDAGLIDVVFAMDYRAEPDFASLEKVRQRLRHPEALVPLLGNYESVGQMGQDGYRVTPRDPQLLTHLVERARTFGAGSGVAVYLYSMLSDAQISALHAGAFAQDRQPRWPRAGSV